MKSNLLFLLKPYYQALLFLLLTPVVILILRPGNADKAWSTSVFIFFLFLLVNSAMLWFEESQWRYFFYSIGCAVSYILIISVMLPAILKVLRLDGSGESAMAFLVIIYQPFALMLVMLAKWVVMKWF